MEHTNPDFRCGTVALLGQPNVGKSTLMNRIIGAKVAIVTPKPQTTRHRILGIYTDQACQVVFVDTPGIHKGDKQLNRNMVRTAYAAAAEADLLAIMQDVTRPLDSGTRTLIERFADGRLPQPRIHVLNKVDKIRKDALLPRLLQMQQLDPGRQPSCLSRPKKARRPMDCSKRYASTFPRNLPCTIRSGSPTRASASWRRNMCASRCFSPCTMKSRSRRR